MMRSLPALGAAVLVKAAELTNHTFTLPLVVFSPTSRCNSRCLSCDWWMSDGASDLTLDEVARVADDLAGLGTRLVVFSGGEPLLRPDVFDLAQRFARHTIALHLLTSGLALGRHAESVARTFARVIVSLDASTSTAYQQVRGVAALEQVLDGAKRLRALAPHIPITARATLHRHNFRELPAIVTLARRAGFDGVSFLAADVSSRAFGRREPLARDRLALSPDEVVEFRQVVERTIGEHAEAFTEGFVHESPDKLRRLPAYYAALGGAGPFPPVSCNAPWASVVIEADGQVRPCFFHRPLGSVREVSLNTLVRRHLPHFRQSLQVRSDAVCQRCVCTLDVSLRSRPWM